MTPLTTIFMLSLSVLNTKKGGMQAAHRRPSEGDPSGVVLAACRGAAERKLQGAVHAHTGHSRSASHPEP